MQEKVSAYYQSRITTEETGLKKIRKILFNFYLFRLFTFLLFLVFLNLYFRSGNQVILLILSLASLVAFLVSVKFDLKFRFLEKYSSNKLLLNNNELKILDHQYSDRETGSCFHYLNPSLAADFDLLGPGSLFQYLNRCSTLGGKLKLAKALCQLRQEELVISEKQEAIRELTEKNEFVQDFQTHGMFITEKGNELSNLQSWLDQPFEKSRLLQMLAILIPIFNLGWITMVILGPFTVNSLDVPILLSLSIVGFNLKKINEAHLLLTKTAGTLKSYTTVIRKIEEEEFRADYLTRLQGLFRRQDIKAGDSLTKLFKLLNSFDFRLNLPVSILLNAFLIYDIQIWLRLGNWKTRHKETVPQWFDALYNFDALTSFSVYAFNNQETVTYPQISEEEFTFQAEEMGHPLLHPATRVCNSFGFSGSPRIMIITGANMAGKSTFLRTLSVNVVLAMNGAPVCAKNFIFTPCDILSSIKIQDSLSNNESYFYAELTRIREIIEHLKTQPRTLVVLDEILRGTNSRDKQAGSRGLLEKLISLNAVVLVATHDLSLGEMEKSYPDIVLNNCFEVELTNDQLIFDYKLKKGISQKLNASFLMKKMQIID
ncbi:MAG: hypothetical protein WCK18_07060 [Prolixibacteraceae bacterium]